VLVLQSAQSFANRSPVAAAHGLLQHGHLGGELPSECSPPGGDNDDDDIALLEHNQEGSG